MEPEVTFPEHWDVPRELRRALPRETQRSATGTFMVILALCLVIGSGVLFVVMRNLRIRQQVEVAQLRDQGRESTGTVLKRWREGKGNTPQVSYRFEVDRQAYEGQASAPNSAWPDLMPGAPIGVRYVASNPALNQPAGWDRETMPEWVPYMFPAVMMLAVAVIVIASSRQASLLADGLPAPGVVVKCSRVKGGFAIRYVFRLKDGTRRKGRAQVSRRVENGSVICVLYSPDNPGRNSLYPLRWYRVV